MKAPRWQWTVMIATAIALPVALFAAYHFGLAGYGPPAILKSAETDWPGERDENGKLAKELAKEFPSGSGVAAMTAALTAQGFRIHAPVRICSTTVDAGSQHTSCHDTAANHNALYYRWSETGCSHFVTVAWTADAQGRLVGVTGHYADVCV